MSRSGQKQAHGLAMGAEVTCPWCGSRLPVSRLDKHLRRELDYCPFVCRLCHHAFLTADDARYHFEGSGLHPTGTVPAIMEDRDMGLEQKVLRALAEASGSLEGMQTEEKSQSCAAIAEPPSEPQPHNSPMLDEEKREDFDLLGTEASDVYLLSQSGEGIRGIRSPSPQDQRSIENFPEEAKETYLTDETFHLRSDGKQSPDQLSKPPADRMSPVPETDEDPGEEEKAEKPRERIMKITEAESKGLSVRCHLDGDIFKIKSWQQHVSRKHLSEAAFCCTFQGCDFGFFDWHPKQRLGLVHSEKAHPEQGETLVDMRGTLRGRLYDQAKLCFGKDFPSEVSALRRQKTAATSKCLLCAESVRSSLNALISHLLRHHLKMPRAECRLCSFRGFHWMGLDLRRHQVSRHGVAKFAMRDWRLVRDNGPGLRASLEKTLREAFAVELRLARSSSALPPPDRFTPSQADSHVAQFVTETNGLT